MKAYPRQSLMYAVPEETPRIAFCLGQCLDKTAQYSR